MTPKKIWTYKGSDGIKELREIENEKEETQKEKNEPFEFQNSEIVKSDYIQIPGTEKVISRFEVQGYNNMTWEDTHFKLQENGLYMQTIKLFTTHFMNVLNSYNSEGKSPLFDANGNPISKKETEDIAMHMLKDHIAVYGNSKGAWTWLDAFFEKQDDKMKMRLEHKVKIDSNGKKILVADKIEDLEKCLMEDCYVDLKFNSQGFPTEKCKKQSYTLGKNVYFDFPRSDSVARFGAVDDGAYLDCSGDPPDGNYYLGVFALAKNK